MSEDSAVRVTLRDVYEAVQETHDAVVTQSVKLDAAIVTGQDHETRLRRVEKRMYAIPSGAAVVAAASAAVSLFAVLH